MTADNKQVDNEQRELIASGHTSLNPIEKPKDAQLRIRKLPPWVVQTLKKIAQAADESLEEYLRTVIVELALKPQHDFAQSLKEIRAEIKDDFHANCPSSTDLIRSIREES